jgi:hypothetical protein
LPPLRIAGDNDKTGQAVVRVNDLDEEQLYESFTLTVKVLEPATVGTPLITPPGLRLSPNGSVPKLKLQECGAVPPAAARLTL